MKYKNVTVKKNLKCNSWYARYRFAGKQYYISGKTQKEVYNKLKKALDQTKNLTYTKCYTINTYYPIWLKTFKFKSKDTTIREYEISLNHFTNKFMNTDMKLVNAHAIQEQLERITATRQRQKAFILLKDIFDKARKENIINSNPLEILPKPEHISKETRALTHAEEKIFINTCKQQNDIVADYFLITLFQGLRRGECLAIKGKDLDFENKTISINQSINQRTQRKNTKNKNSVRIIPMFDRSVEILQKYKDTDGYIFKFVTNKVDRQLKYILEKSNIPKFTTKELRHTFVTRCGELNIPDHIIQSWVGHQIGSRVTKQTYTHVTQDASNKFKNILNNNSN